jgi:hypothetical protein
MLHTQQRRCHVLVHVHDVLILAPSDIDINWLRDRLSKTFDLTDNGVAKRFLGIGIIYHAGTIYLSQEAYIDKILKKYNLEDSHQVDRPYFDHEILNPNEGTADPEETHQYRKRSGSLVWLMVNTRPDIPFPVTKLARYAHKPSNRHFVAIKRMYRYIKGTKKLRNRYKPSTEALYGFVDADWAGKHATVVCLLLVLHSCWPVDS